jgi:hypothetical protein
LRLVIFAFATRTASVLAVDLCFGFCCEAFFDFPPTGIKGSTGVVTFEARSTGCVLIGPVTALGLGIIDNSTGPDLFKTNEKPAWTG